MRSTTPVFTDEHVRVVVTRVSTGSAHGMAECALAYRGTKKTENHKWRAQDVALNTSQTLTLRDVSERQGRIENPAPPHILQGSWEKMRMQGLTARRQQPLARLPYVS